MTTVDKHHIVNSHSSVGAIAVKDNDNSIKRSDGKVVVDEEIDSCEGEDYDEKMFQVALVNSVIDTGRARNVTDQVPGQRKRRRPGEEAIVPAPLISNAFQLPNDPLNELQHVQQDSNISSIPMPSIHLHPPPRIQLEQTQQQTTPAPTHNVIKLKQELMPQQNIGVTARGHSSPGIVSKPPGSSPAMLSGISLPAQQQRRPKDVVPVSGIKNNGMQFPGNPLNVKKKAPRKRKAKPVKESTKTKVIERLSIPVPNPLLASTPPIVQPLNQTLVGGRQDAIVSSTSSVPCPLPVPSPLDVGSTKEGKPPQVRPLYIPPFDPTKLKKVSENSTVQAPVQTRARVFSVDLDPSTFDFSDLSSITGGNGDNRASSDSDLPIFQGRDRAFSFEVFNFAGDDLLPHPASSSSMLQAPSLTPVSVEAPTRRPRGDSIIFDPSSFQDGGIHEKNALEKARFIAPPQQSMSHHTNQSRPPAPIGGGITGTFSTSQSSDPMPLILPPGPSLKHPVQHSQLVAGQNRIPHAARSASTAPTASKPRAVPTPTISNSRVTSSNRNSLTNSVQIATLPSSLSAGAATNAHSPPTFQMELLNKDGRIGIYLPEARRLRIARFHAKRKMRIW
eukprot:CAMPEP_0197197008 /NCGR_PEP_ID=MMETSP1423-20130617/32649_1 /TAXON_ID=476441 /ORGANISM="Pseudo-nitzschia heimii, Strain UNC1101" /LENGTH=616 /DNA_ID=CAMNT_0042650823 /DNA_START=684 /DNA_END=2531 /DNA_ORIENTATION=-